MTGGIKTIFGTGGYDRLGRLMMSNFWLGETSTLSLAAVITLPMAYYVISHSLIFEPYRGRMLRTVFGCYIVLTVMCMIGTSARTGVIAFGALLLFGIKGIFRRTLIVLGAVGLFYVAQPYLPGKSLGRFGTISTYKQDDSATIRIAVWHWAMRYAAEHPFGGGFGIFYTNSFDYQVQDERGETLTKHSKGTAPHSVYFEVLGEQGYPGAFLYLAMIAGGLWGTWRISRLPHDKTGPPWHAAFARTLFVCIMLYVVGASFVGIAFQPLLYLFLGFYCSIYRLVQSQHANRPKFSAEPKLYEAPA
jgi:probable O-glycosylation ligase (exosortase A-associated)